MLFTKRSVAIAGPLLLASCLAVPALAQPAALGGPKILIHGNYCGPGNNAPLPPIDALDAACARHDACTPSRGLPSQACNLRLQRDANLIAHDPHQPGDLRALAGFIATTATLIPSERGARQTPAAVATGPAPGFYAPAPDWAGSPNDVDGDPDGPDAD